MPSNYPPRQDTATIRRPFHSSPHHSAAPPRRPLPELASIDDRLAEFTLNEAISTPEVQLKLPDNKGLSEPQPLGYVLSGIDRTTHFVQQMTPVDDPREFAVVRIVTRNELVREVTAKRDLARKQASEQKRKKPKQLELNWAIAPTDLEIKMKQMESFLEKGKKVELMMANKRRQRKATREEAEKLLSVVRTKCEELGASEVAKFTGAILGQATMTVEKLKK
ncbi:hypothetical protein PV10_04552 [Exophiala mesophila]|uniref:Altered inheritance of mitochondria protein 23, mitochondrial n=1 Tax=Exophiala mesophila TaxID=212818 RepID=A0A0D1ZF01_EXOME|nr:uncharacterized protein PV10_04552 [Exophiala mesophila]KIV93332.1 hypothetical protein PV10_04552 [Exophiala mesophila]